MITRRNNTRFSLMICGSKGSGKSAFFNSLVNKHVVKGNQSGEIDIYLLNLETDNGSQKITFIDTPGFGGTMNDEKIHEMIVEYIKEQFDLYIEEETKIRRNPKFEDTRVHCMLYLIPGTGNGLKQRDIAFLKKVFQIVNVVPVINKVEGMTPTELAEVKQLINDQLKYYNINIFDFENEYVDPDALEGVLLNALIPFASVLPEKLGEQMRVRVHPSGIIEIDNPLHSDYARLRNSVLRTHTNSMIEITDTELYEKYRSDALENILQE